MEEIWKSIKGYESLYEVSNLGSIKSLGNSKLRKEKILKYSTDSNGYLKVDLYINGIGKTKKVHKLAAIAFLNHIPCGMKLVVNHKDFNKQNNYVENLEIVTQRENANKKHIESTSKYIGVTWNKDRNKWHSRIIISGKLTHLGLFNNEIDANNAYQNKLKSL